MISWNHDEIVFYPPEGQGEHKHLVLIIGSQTAVGPEEYYFTYTAPQVYNILPVANPTTDGGYTMTINGTSFGINGASVILEDPLFNSTNDRMEPSSCAIIQQSHEAVVCTEIGRAHV